MAGKIISPMGGEGTSKAADQPTVRGGHDACPAPKSMVGEEGAVNGDIYSR